MSKTRFFALSVISAVLFACGSQDGGPPELADKASRTISPYDTLIVKFDSDIAGINKLDSSNIEGNVKLLAASSKNKLLFVGKNTTPGGFHRFDDLLNDSIVFKDIKNSDGYVKKRAVFYFSTFPILDMEPNNDEKTAYDITRNVGVTFAGIIDKDIGESKDGYQSYDTKDFYKHNLKLGDIISVTASNRSTPFKISFRGPCYYDDKSKCNDKTVDIAKKTDTELRDTVKTGHLEPGSGTDFEETAEFYIIVSDDDISAKPNPYLITVKVTRP